MRKSSKILGVLLSVVVFTSVFTGVFSASAYGPEGEGNSTSLTMEQDIVEESPELQTGNEDEQPVSSFPQQEPEPEHIQEQDNIAESDTEPGERDDENLNIEPDTEAVETEPQPEKQPARQQYSNSTLGDMLGQDEVQTFSAPAVENLAQLLEAIDQAAEGDVIKLGNDIQLEDPLVLDKSLTLDGGGKTLFAAAGKAHIEQPYVADTVYQLTLRNITLNGNGNGGGVVLESKTVLAVEKSEFTKIKGMAALDVQLCDTAVLDTASFTECEVSGSVVYFGEASVVDVLASKFTGNLAIGGALAFDVEDIPAGQITIDGSLFENNNSGATGALLKALKEPEDLEKAFGGAVSILGAGYHGSVKIANSKFTNNYGSMAGAVYIAQATMGPIHIQKNKFENNKGLEPEVSAGALLMRAGGITRIDECQFTGNSGAEGGGLHVEVFHANLYVTNSKITGNNASIRGGGFMLDGEADSGNAVTLRNLDISGNAAEIVGGGMYNRFLYNAVHFNKVTVNQNTVTGPGDEESYHLFIGGGGIASDDSNLVLDSETVVSNNTVLGGKDAVLYGGGIYFNRGSLHLEGAKVTGNSLTITSEGGAEALGGGVHVGESSMDAGVYLEDGAEITGNEIHVEAEYYVKAAGGGVYSNGLGIFDTKGTVDLGGNVVNALSQQENAEAYGGAVALIRTKIITLDAGLSIKGNSVTATAPEGLAEAAGGGMYMQEIEKSAIIRDGVVIADNTLAAQGDDSATAGGAIFGNLVASFNFAGEASGSKAQYGGALFLQGGEEAYLASSAVIEGNEAEYGGGIYLYKAERLTINGGRIANNTATYGGGVYANEVWQEIRLRSGDIAYNVAEADGGGIYVQQATKLRLGGLLEHNSAQYGGAVYVASEETLVYGTNATLQDNVADFDGGAIYFADIEAILYAMENEYSLHGINFARNQANPAYVLTAYEMGDIDEDWYWQLYATYFGMVNTLSSPFSMADGSSPLNNLDIGYDGLEDVSEEYRDDLAVITLEYRDEESNTLKRFSIVPHADDVTYRDALERFDSKWDEVEAGTKGVLVRPVETDLNKAIDGSLLVRVYSRLPDEPSPVEDYTSFTEWLSARMEYAALTGKQTTINLYDYEQVHYDASDADTWPQLTEMVTVPGNLNLPGVKITLTYSGSREEGNAISIAEQGGRHFFLEDIQALVLDGIVLDGRMRDPATGSFGAEQINRDTPSGGIYVSGQDVMTTISGTLQDGKHQSILRYNSSDEGGAIDTQGAARLENLHFYRNFADGSGGALFASYFEAAIPVEIDNCLFEKNEAYWGGAIFSEAALHVTGSTFDGNQAEESGGAIDASHMSGMEYTRDVYKDVTLKDNVSYGVGGGIHMLRTQAEIEGGEFIGNIARGGNGGALHLDTAGLQANDVLFEGNMALALECDCGEPFWEEHTSCGCPLHTADITGFNPLTYDWDGMQDDPDAEKGFGGAIMHRIGEIYSHQTPALEITNSTFRENYAMYGGAVCDSSTLLVSSIKDSRIYDNKAYYGGGISLAATMVDPDLTGTQIYENEAVYGGGIAVRLDDKMQQIVHNPNQEYVITNGTLRGNIAAQQGGGLYAFNLIDHYGDSYFSLRVRGTSFEQNEALEGGGAYLAGSLKSVHFTDTEFLNNKAVISGGGIRSEGYASLYVFDNIIHGNKAGTDEDFDDKPGYGMGGGIYAGDRREDDDDEEGGYHYNSGYAWIPYEKLTVTGTDFADNQAALGAMAFDTTVEGAAKIQLIHDVNVQDSKALSAPFDTEHDKDYLRYAYNNLDINYLGADFYGVTYHANYKVEGVEYTYAAWELWSTEYHTLLDQEETGIYRPGDYVFLGWSTNPDSATAELQPEGKIEGRRNIDLYAIWKQNIYPVTYYGNGGTLGGSVDQVDGGSYPADTRYTLRKNDGNEGIGFVNEGSYFAGWSLTEEGPVIDGPSILVTAPGVKLYAQWLDNPEVTYHGNGGKLEGGVDFVKDGSYAPETDYPLRANDGEGGIGFKNEGYYFVNWSYTSDGAPLLNTTIPIPEDDVNLYALWKANPTVTYDGNGGKTEDGDTTVAGGSYAPKTIYTIKGNDVILFEQEGYKFIGWSLTDDGEVYPAATLEIAKEDVVLYAVWEELPVPKYTVTYDGNGGKTGDGDLTVEDGSYITGFNYTIKGNDTIRFAREGYEFKGWSLTNDGEAYEGKTLEIGTENVTLYALWELEEVPVEKYTVTYDGNGGKTGDGDLTVEDGSYIAGFNYTIKGNDTIRFAREGYEFKGWSLTNDGEAYEGKTLEIGTENVTLYALWELEEVPVEKYTVTYDGNGGKTGDGDLTVEDGSYIAGFNYTIKGNDTIRFAREGYEFKGWSLTNDGEAYEGKTLEIGTENVTLYALWELEEVPVPKYTVTYDGNGGKTGDGDLTVEDGSYIAGFNYTIKGNDTIRFAREGYEFKGWSLTNDGEAYEGKTLEIGTENVTLYALWELEEVPVEKYTVAYNGNGNTGGSAPRDTNQYLTGEKVTVLDKGTLVRTGYTFLGWATSSNAQQAQYAAGGSFTIKGNTTLYAVWQKDVPVTPPTTSTPTTSTPTTSTPTTSVPTTTSSSVSEESSSTPDSSEGGGGTEQPSTSRPATSRPVVSGSSSSSRVSTSQSSSSAVSSGVSSASQASSSEPSSEIAGTSSSDGGGDTSTPSSSSGISVEDLPENPTKEELIEATGSVNLFGNEVPLGGLSVKGGWSLVSLLLSVLSLLLGIIMLVRFLVALRADRKPQYDEQDEEMDMDYEADEEQPQSRKRITRRLVAAISGILPLLVFLIVENLGSPMVLLNRFTPFIAAFTVLGLVLFVIGLGARTTRQDDSQDDMSEA